jgi:hypothetical protein
MDGPVDSDENTSDECAKIPQATADEKRVPAKASPHEAGVSKDGKYETEIHEQLRPEPLA